ncbi:hypothetical protein FOL47_002383 [Perkinsus chesapeaki]|uniref:Uncharacterized protein n=1 Tax=Perkinsus chesapeaki TaxID=330153 RepID=A0A7J6MDR4_PERCH|nr:hypothetical protein FOL47_002383 [Perkinsus chesapeaki]
MVPAINTSRPCRGCSDDTEEISLNEGLASTGIVFHRHQLKHMATSLPSPGALKELASVCNCNTEICSPLVLRPEPKKIKDDTSSRASVKSTSKEFDEADDNYDVIEESAKEYSGKQYCMDVGRRSTTTTSGAGEECLFLFEEQGCYEEVVICTLPVSDVAGAPRCSASLHSAFYTVNLSGQLAAPGFLESGQAEVLSTAKLAEMEDLVVRVLVVLGTTCVHYILMKCGPIFYIFCGGGLGEVSRGKQASIPLLGI